MASRILLSGSVTVSLRRSMDRKFPPSPPLNLAGQASPGLCPKTTPFDGVSDNHHMGLFRAGFLGFFPSGYSLARTLLHKAPAILIFLFSFIDATIISSPLGESIEKTGFLFASGTMKKKPLRVKPKNCNPVAGAWK
jgi:hypothetical protein